MNDAPSSSPTLPEGWFYPDRENADRLHQELQRELPSGHLLDGLAVETFAWREYATDDVLFRHTDEPDRFTVIHLSWLGRTEINSLHPTVEFDGTFDGFLAYEEKVFGLTQSGTKTMNDLAQLFDELERDGWVCLLKWDGERKSKTKTVVITNSSNGRAFRGDFNTFAHAHKAVVDWLLHQNHE